MNQTTFNNLVDEITTEVTLVGTEEPALLQRRIEDTLERYIEIDDEEEDREDREDRDDFEDVGEILAAEDDEFPAAPI